jgi:UDP-N-acetylglucosamine 2-epimerase (non-hydrolysing)/GDP/UDP-N,N'-diacetylbacillosamine 2-epimerase (hydrolysing)
VPLLEKSDLSVVLQCEFKTFNYLITYHPETIKQTNPELTISRILKALDRLTETNLFFTAANADTNGRIINQIIENYVSNNTDKTRYVKNLGQINYLSLVKNVDAVIGNSSSGIIEAPLLKTPTINIGKRQAGRLKAESIIDIEDKEEAILSAIDFIKSSSFRSKIAEVKSLYGKGETSTKIKNTLKSINIENLTSKKFFDHDIGA